MIAFFFNRWVLMTLLVASILPAFFARIAWEQYGDRARTMIGSTDEPRDVALADLAAAKVRYGQPRNDSSQIVLTDVKFETRSAGLTVIGAHLLTTVAGNDYPNLVVDIKSSDATLLRTLELTPSQYEHGTTLTDEHIRFSVELRSGEARIAAHPSYPLPAPPSSAPLSAPSAPP